MTFFDVDHNHPLTPGRILRDGQPHTVISGALHYFRVPRALWSDRLARLAAMGCNTVETYVAWNFHVPHPDRAPDFDGDRDLGAFIDEAGRQGLDVLVRPGPYICAEWDLGGLPSWLLADPRLRTREQGVSLRTSDPAWLEHVDAWFDQLLPIVAERQASRGGPVVAVQVENEYGSFGNDHTYLQHLADGLRRRGIVEPLFTSDGPSALMLTGGTLEDVWATVNFGSRSAEAFATLQEHRPGAPTMVMEFWNGWFDHFGGPHHVRDVGSAAAELTEMLTGGHSVNFYMAHGGTNFGVWAGANETDGVLLPDVTSYDYDAPIAEDGTLTPKFWAFREVIAAHTGQQPPEPPAAPARQRPQRLTVDSAVLGLDAVLDTVPAVTSAVPRSLEDLGLHHGVVRYRTRVRGRLEQTLTLPQVRDVARVSLDGTTVAHLSGLTVDPLLSPSVRLEAETGEHALDVTVASLGRVNYGAMMGDRKGLSSARLDYQNLFGWSQQGLDLTELPALDWLAAVTDPADGPAFARCTVSVDAPADVWVALPGWHLGYVFLNGFNLGRYWNPAGPQQALYAPGPLWRAGENELVVCELVAAGREVELVDEPRLGPVAD